MRLAYADPPYLGMGKRYPEHPEAYIWDDPQTHRDLLERLDDEFDGWAFSASAPSLFHLGLSPRDRERGWRIAAWTKPFAAFKRNVRIAYAWEPIIFKPAHDSSRDGAPVGRDFIAEPIALRRGLVGAKPERFCRQVLDLMGWIHGDEVVDLFPGTGVMGRVVAAAEAQGVLNLSGDDPA